jgi:hypothetical protein
MNIISKIIFNFKKKNGQQDSKELSINSELLKLKSQYRVLECQLIDLQNEKSDLDKIIFEFNHRHSQELGAIIVEILKYRKNKFKHSDSKYQEALNDEKDYKEQINNFRKRDFFLLTSEESKELKLKFRKAAILCHPDKVSIELREAAEKIFIELKVAYDSNDLKGVSEILENLENGGIWEIEIDKITEINKLENLINNLQLQISKIIEEIYKIKQSEAFVTISSIVDMNKYFFELKENLQMELEDLKTCHSGDS